MRAYLTISGFLFALLFVLHVWRVVAEWNGFDEAFWFVSTTALLALGLAVWAWRLLGELGRRG